MHTLTSRVAAAMGHYYQEIKYNRLSASIPSVTNNSQFPFET